MAKSKKVAEPKTDQVKELKVQLTDVFLRKEYLQSEFTKLVELENNFKSRLAQLLAKEGDSGE